jgi:hypothetical protein
LLSLLLLLLVVLATVKLSDHLTELAGTVKLTPAKCVGLGWSLEENECTIVDRSSTGVRYT